ncbi:MAG TPA: DUF4382 domain-containing protein [Acidobacteriaceae bacterium]
MSSLPSSTLSNLRDKSPICLLSLAAASLLAVGCGGAISSTNPVTNAVTGGAFIIGTDAPVTSVTSFSVQVQSINAIDAAGKSTSLLSGSPTVDFARFNGLQTLLDMNDVPADTYTSVAITLGPATIGYLNAVSGSAPTIVSQPATLTTNTINITLAKPLVVSQTAPVGIHMDFDLRKSIQVDSKGQITGMVTPTFDIRAVGPSDSDAYVDEFDAAVVSVNTTAQSFVIQGPHGRNFTVNVSGNTEWDNSESLSSLSTSSIVQISGQLDRADATIDADEVAILSQNGFFADGQVTYVTPTSGAATSFDLFVRGLLPTTTGLTLGQIAQVNLTGQENFFIYRQRNILSQFLFNSSLMLPGQAVAIGGPASGATNPQAVTTKRVILRYWGFNGIVVPGSINPGSNTFQMQMNGFAGLLIPQNVTVYVSGPTAFRSGLTAFGSVAASTNVRVVGLLVKDPVSGQTVLLARYVDALN